MERNDGYVRACGAIRWPATRRDNRSVLKPYGVWLVISPFNFPPSLTGGAAGAALAAGNTVVSKPSPETPWTRSLARRLLPRCGAARRRLQFRHRPRRCARARRWSSIPASTGVTFTGSLCRRHGDLLGRSRGGEYPRPCRRRDGRQERRDRDRGTRISTKRPSASSARRSASRGRSARPARACTSKQSIHDALVERCSSRRRTSRVGDPTRARHLDGAADRRERRWDVTTCCRADRRCEARRGSCTAAQRLDRRRARARPIRARRRLSRAPLDHRCGARSCSCRSSPWPRWSGSTRRCGCERRGLRAHRRLLRLTSGEMAALLRRDRGRRVLREPPQGATTGAWPGYQPFGGWKGSGSTGKAGGPYYFLPHICGSSRRRGYESRVRHYFRLRPVDQVPSQIRPPSESSV